MTAVVLLFLGVAAAAVTAGVRLRRAGREPRVPASGPLRATALTTMRWRLAGLGSGVVVAVASAQQDALGRGLLLAAPWARCASWVGS
ncbi:hypothetical protein [Blastococcus brunescens]|uniref:Uncharacterized protein n=1 Tax=Blastococcus brunescens TaxID=1564165 RepID=A0ABZ1AVQ9_9ACTN|nr:hypothetical protein [Blastococcus sp. BMG 8361]WRL62534.1 hypothetical protein U6N30_21440 [Blastococcus sp. BMG 8361]